MTDKKEACSRTDHPAGYIELAFLESSTQAVDELVAHLRVANRESQPVLRIYVSARHTQQAQPIVYLLRRLREVQFDLAPNRPTRIAVGFHFMPLAHLLEAFIRTLRTQHLKFKAVGAQQEESAIQWLLQDS